MKINEITGMPAGPFHLGYICHHYRADDADAAAIVGDFLVEGGHQKEFGQGRRVVLHRTHIPDGQDHLHFYLKKKHLYSLNRNGTAHDASHGEQLHRWAMDAIKTDYSGFTIPGKGIIESTLLTEDSAFLVEAYVTKSALVPEELIRAAVNVASMIDWS
jgi:hypothetical protein